MYNIFLFLKDTDFTLRIYVPKHLSFVQFFQLLYKTTAVFIDIKQLTQFAICYTHRFVAKLLHFTGKVSVCTKLCCYVGSGRGIEIRTRVETTEPLHIVVQTWEDCHAVRSKSYKHTRRKRLQSSDFFISCILY